MLLSPNNVTYLMTSPQTGGRNICAPFVLVFVSDGMQRLKKGMSRLTENNPPIVSAQTKYIFYANKHYFLSSDYSLMYIFTVYQIYYILIKMNRTVDLHMYFHTYVSYLLSWNIVLYNDKITDILFASFC